MAKFHVMHGYHMIYFKYLIDLIYIYVASIKFSRHARDQVRADSKHYEHAL